MKGINFTSTILYIQGHLVAQVLLALGLASTYLSVYSVAIAPYHFDNPGLFRWGEIGLLDVFSGVAVTFLQSGTTLVLLSPGLLLGIWENTNKTVSGYTQIPHALARFLFLFGAGLFIVLIGWSMVVGSFVGNIAAVNQFLGITDNMNVDSVTRCLQGFIVGGSELAMTLALNASLAADIKANAHHNLQATTAGSRPRATAAPGQRPNVPPPDAR